MPVSLIYTMNEPYEKMKEYHYLENLQTTHNYIYALLGYNPQIQYVCNTYEFNDYSKYEASYWNEQEKKEWHDKQFPLDLETAYQNGKKMVSQLQNK